MQPPAAQPAQAAASGDAASGVAQQQAGLAASAQPVFELGPFSHSCSTIYIDEEQQEPARPARDGSATASTTGSSSSSDVMSDEEAWAQVGSRLCCGAGS